MILTHWLRKPLLMAPAADAAAGGAAGDDAAAQAAARGDFLDPADAADDAAAPAAEADDKGADAADDKVADAADDADADDAPPAKPAKKDDDKTPMIPKARFDDARRKDRERIQRLEQQLAEARGTTDENSPGNRIKALETKATELEGQYAKALDDGDTKKATELMSQLRKLDRDIVAIQTTAEASYARAVAVEQVRVDNLIEKLEAAHPELDPESDEYDEDLVGSVAELRAGFEATGMSSSAALAKAAKYLLPGKATTAAVNDAAPAAKPAKKAEDVDAERKSQAVRKAAATAGKTPPSLSKAPGLDSHKAGAGAEGADVTKMTEQEFTALPDSKKRQLRGDYV